MARSDFRLFLSCSIIMFVVLLLISPRPIQAQPPGNWVNDGRLWVYLELDGRSIKTATSGNPIQVNMTGPMRLLLRVNNTGIEPINVTAAIVFYYQGLAVFTLGVRDPVTNKSWVSIPGGTGTLPSEANLDLGQALSTGGIQIVTGLFQAYMAFVYQVGTNASAHILEQEFYLNIPSGGILTSVAGIATTVATAGAVWAVGNNFYSLIDGLRAASKFRTIQKKAAEIRSLPNLTVLGALPLLFSIVKQMKTKKPEGTEGVSGYIIKQRLREVAPDAWQQDKCPKCKANWSHGQDRCKKCGIDLDDAKRAYGELLTAKVEPCVRLLGKKKALSVRKIAKKTKSNNYNAGVIGAAMVDTAVVEVTKIETPIRSFAMNMAGLGFLIVTWDQLLGYGSSQWQTTLTIVTAALSVGVIVALYFARRSQISKMREALEAGKPIMPTEEERISAPAEEKESTPDQVSEEDKGPAPPEDSEEQKDESS